MEQCKLYQNRPNPFSESTTVEYYLPKGINKAQLYVYNMQGRQVKNFNIAPAFGYGSVTIEGGSMEAGMYMYTLITDGKEVDTKKMILTN